MLLSDNPFATDSQSGEQVRYIDNRLGTTERRNGVARPEGHPSLVDPIDGIPKDLERSADEVEKPSFWNPGAGV